VAGCHSVVELGCGCGLNLWQLKQAFSDLEFAGADFSANAVTIARRCGQNVSEFNFYDESTYSFL
jgi:methylase of polypeptide subunit release factors